jgi:hypothetical protein
MSPITRKIIVMIENPLELFTGSAVAIDAAIDAPRFDVEGPDADLLNPTIEDTDVPIFLYREVSNLIFMALWFTILCRATT